MDIQRFEQEILRLAFETKARITAASVAYYLGIPSREANRMLNVLLEDGVIELDSDEGGNLYYHVPQRTMVDSALKGTSEQREAVRELDALYQMNTPSTDLALSEREEEPPVVMERIGLVRASEDDGMEPFSPSAMRPREVSAHRETDGMSAAMSAPPRRRYNSWLSRRSGALPGATRSLRCAYGPRRGPTSSHPR